jgi:hypothetical protein
MTENHHVSSVPTTSVRSRSPVVELRQYTLHPGQRDVLINLFDREFVEAQELAGMDVIGQFRDLGDPDRFVWLRGFSDMTARLQSLKDFYGGPAWIENRSTANATMIDSDNVLLLRPARSDSGFAPTSNSRLPRESQGDGPGMVVATVYYLSSPAEHGFVDYFEEALVPAISASDINLLGYFISEHAENTFPVLPVREGENVFIWFASFADRAGGEAFDFASGPVAEAARRAPNLIRLPELIRLTPTARSLLNGEAGPSPAATPRFTSTGELP